MTELEVTLSKLDRQEQLDFFLKTTTVPGSSLRERSFADYLEPILTQMGFTIEYDHAHQEFQGNCGNLIAYWPGTDPRAEPLLFSAHMDTILDSSGCIPVIDGNVIRADGNHILGSDDRSAISSYLEAIRAVQASGMRCGPIELLFTVNEERGLCGAKGLDHTKVRSRHGFIFDHPGNVGQVIKRSPYWRPFNVWFRMKCGSAGGHIAEKADLPNAFDMGVKAYQAMPHGYLDQHETAVLIGIMQGGEVSSIVPGELYMRGEVRSYRKEFAEQRLSELRSACEAAASFYNGTVEFDVEPGYEGYEISDDNPAYQCFCRASESAGVSWFPDEVLGGADTNFLRAYGINCLTLGNGYQDTHTYRESISIDNLEAMARITVCIIYHWYQTHTPEQKNQT